MKPWSFPLRFLELSNSFENMVLILDLPMLTLVGNESIEKGALLALSKEMLSQGDDKGRHNEGPDVLSEAAMINAYYICHNVQVSPGKPNKIGKGQRKRKLLQNLIHFPPLQITSEEQVKLLLKSFNKFPQERETKI